MDISCEMQNKFTVLFFERFTIFPHFDCVSYLHVCDEVSSNITSLFVLSLSLTDPIFTEGHTKKGNFWGQYLELEKKKYIFERKKEKKEKLRSPNIKCFHFVSPINTRDIKASMLYTEAHASGGENFI